MGLEHKPSLSKQSSAGEMSHQCWCSSSCSYHIRSSIFLILFFNFHVSRHTMTNIESDFYDTQVLIYTCLPFFLNEMWKLVINSSIWSQRLKRKWKLLNLDANILSLSSWQPCLWSSIPFLSEGLFLFWRSCSIRAHSSFFSSICICISSEFERLNELTIPLHATGSNWHVA